MPREPVIKVPEKDYYSILELEPSATPEEIKAAYRRLVKKHHPDIQAAQQEHEPNLDLFRDVQEAYQVLSVRDSRISYDLSRKKHAYKFTPVEVEFQQNMNIQKGMRDKTGNMPATPPPKGSFAEKRMAELKHEREQYNVNFLGYYNGGLPQPR